MVTKILTRQELYDLVWCKPMIQLAKDFHLSDNGLRKICKKNDIPIPQMGHWQKLKFGKKISKLPLTHKEFADPIKITIEEANRTSYGQNPKVNTIAEKIRNNKSLVFKVSDRLSKPDDVVVKTQANLLKRKSEGSYCSIKGGIQTDRGFPSIIVSPKNVVRTLRILDNLIKNFKALGYQIQLNDEGLNLIAHDEKMILYFREKCNAVDTMSSYGWTNRELVPNGKLAIKINQFGNSEFVDTEKALLEHQIEKILIKVESGFQSMLEMREHHRIAEEKREELRKIEQISQKLKEEELNKFIEFYNDAHRWKRYIILKEYYECLKLNQLESKEKLDWIDEKLLWYNPMTKQEDKLLNEVDKDTLTSIKKHLY